MEPLAWSMERWGFLRHRPQTARRAATGRLLLVGFVVVLLSPVYSHAIAQPAASAGQALEPAQTGAEKPGRRLAWALSHRIRHSRLANQFRPGFADDDRALVLRTALRVDLVLPQMALVCELQDARAYLTSDQGYVSTTLVNAFDLLQAYVRLGVGESRAGRWWPDVQLGRFSMELGSGRLIAQEAYRDVTRTFTGVSLHWPRTRAASVTAFAVLPVLTLPADRAALLDNEIGRDEEHFNLKFWGALYERPSLPLGARGEVYLYMLDERDDPGRRETRDRELWTAGARVYRAAVAGDWDADAELASQGGSAHESSAPVEAHALDVSARYLHLHAGYTFARPWSPRLSLEYDYASGDSDPADGRWNRFDSLFGHRRAELGPTGIYGALARENLETIGVRVSVAPGSRTDAFTAYRVVRLAAAADAFAGTGVRDLTGRSGRDGGRQVDLRLRFWIVPGALRLDMGVTHLMPGRFLLSAPNATHSGDTTFSYGDVTYTFGSK